MTTRPPARIVVKLSARQDYALVTRFYPDELIGTTRTYYPVTPSSAARLRRLLGAQLAQVTIGPSAGSWRADITPAPARTPRRARRAHDRGIRLLYRGRYGTPRPGLERACRSHRLGLGIPIGLRMTHQGAQCYYLRLDRRFHPARQFHALGALGARLGDAERAVLVQGLYRRLAAQLHEGYRQCVECGKVAYFLDMWHGQAGHLCQECWERECSRTWWDMLSAPALPQRPQFRRHPSLRWKPWPRPLWGVWSSTPRCIRSSRYSGKLYPRPRTRFAQGKGTLHYLAVRRHMAAKCRKMGMIRLRPGLWYDRAGEVAYLQTTVLEPTPHVVMRGA